jgi:glucose-6-phosphate 1-dehydrogenase
MSDSQCDALVFFGATGDLAYKKIFPSLQAMIKRGTLNVPIIGVAKSGWNLDRLQERARDSLEHHGGIDTAAFARIKELLRYIDGGYEDIETFNNLKKTLGEASRPAHYLAIPPTLFATVVEHLAAAGCAPSGARVIVEKPFGRDLASARALNRILLKNFTEERIFRIDHYLGKSPVHSMLFFRFSNSLHEPVWSREHIESIQLTMAEDFGVQGRGAFYDTAGTIRDVIQNHLFQVLSNLAMEPPARTDSESIRDEKVKVLKSIRALGPDDVVRGQFRGYREENGVARDSQVETFAAVRLWVDSWRWQGVPIYIRSGKLLPVTCTEMVARLRRPPSILYENAQPNYLRFRISPAAEIAIGLNVLDSQETGVGQTTELIASRHAGANERDAYERVLSDALAGDRTLFAREDYVEEAWRVVDPVLGAATALHTYERGSWGPAPSAAVTPSGGWIDPIVNGESR